MLVPTLCAELCSSRVACDPKILWRRVPRRRMERVVDANDNRDDVGRISRNCLVKRRTGEPFEPTTRSLMQAPRTLRLCSVTFACNNICRK
jgi:hypothetical protein